jgi:DNA-directed RNA polymerase alpha subunit
MALSISPQTYKAIKTVNAAVETWKNSLNEFSDFMEKYTEEKLLELAEQESALTEKIQNLTQEYNEKTRVFRIDHELAIKADKNNAVQSLASELGYVLLSEGVHNEMVGQIQLNEDKLKSEVAIAKSIVERSYKQAAKEQELTTRAENAEISARITNLNELVRMKDEEIVRLTSLLEEANATVVKVAESKSSTVNVESKR